MPEKHIILDLDHEPAPVCGRNRKCIDALRYDLSGCSVDPIYSVLT